ncbi:MAG TPA: hypothetical protein VNW52_04650, partial [Burkholderiaceae bacterium]|nr:hypothetical protein [Burkholderiaceae bacterium]
MLSGAIPDTLIKSLPDCMSGIDALEIRAALAQVLASDTFVKSRRMCRLLRFLVEKQLINAIRDINEYSIGIEVFDRDPASYNTGDDPIVRVQIGRLREKLKAYYAAVGNNVNLQISIPIGHYMPVIRRPGVGVTDFKHSHMLAILPLRCIS